MIPTILVTNASIDSNKDEENFSTSHRAKKPESQFKKKMNLKEITIANDFSEKSTKPAYDLDPLQTNMLTPNYRQTPRERLTTFLSTAIATPISNSTPLTTRSSISNSIAFEISPINDENTSISTYRSSCCDESSIDSIDPSVFLQTNEINDSKILELHQCKKPFHEHFPINMICLHKLCKNKKLICANCAVEEHKTHIKHCVTIDELISFFENHLSQVKESEFNYEFIKENVKVNYERAIEIIAFINKVFDDLSNQIKNDYQTISEKLNHLETCNISFFKDTLQEIQQKSYESLSEVNQIMENLTKFVEKKKIGKHSQLKWTVNPNDTSILFDAFTAFQHDYLEKLEKTFHYVSLASSEILPKCSIIPKLTQSPCRFNKIYKNWGSAIGFAQAISFECLEDSLNLHGFGHYQPCKFPENGRIHYEYCLLKGKKLDGEIIYEDEGDIEQQKTIYENNMCNILFKLSIPLQKGEIYTIRWINRTPDHDSYFGMGEINDTFPFRFMDSDPIDYKKDKIKKFDHGATNLHQGFIPYLIYYINKVNKAS